MTLYGRKGFYHHRWARVLTVMSPAGTNKVLTAIDHGDGLELKHDAGALPQYIELERGALDRLTQRYHIEVLAPDAWTRQKTELGDRIW